MFKHRITVFTPTYNRAHTLERLYQSLQEQTFGDFEWLVIDDGSTDATKAFFEQCLKEHNAFPISYYFKENSGKHTAINMGLEKAQGELFFTVDSDDYLTDSALEKVNQWVSSLPENEKFCAVVGNMGFSAKETPNTIFPGNWCDADFLVRYPENSDSPIDGERAYVFFTEVHKKYKYPVFENEKFMTEAVAWNRMAHDGYKMRVFNDIIYIFKFLPNGLTLSGGKIFTENPKGYGLWLKEKAKFSNYTHPMKLRLFYSYYASQKDKLNKGQIAKNLGISASTILLLSFLFSLNRIFNPLPSSR